MSLRIMIVDDSPAMRSFIGRIVQLSGLDVESCVHASNGIEALALLRQERVDIVLSDINMPMMDGEELLRALANDTKLRGVPVVVVSTDSTDQRRKRMLELGAKGYVRKPFAPETLRSELELALGEAHV
jgi:two-component system, chemotaxis family, chemotaxis protein CheY